jgi:hypothetical protein
MLSQFLGPYWEGLLTGVMLTLTPSLLAFFCFALGKLAGRRPEADCEHQRTSGAPGMPFTSALAAAR